MGLSCLYITSDAHSIRKATLPSPFTFPLLQSKALAIAGTPRVTNMRDSHKAIFVPAIILEPPARSKEELSFVIIVKINIGELKKGTGY